MTATDIVKDRKGALNALSFALHESRIGVAPCAKP